MRRIVTLLLLAAVGVGMMGAEDPGCDKAKGRTPQSAEHDPKPLNPKRSEKPSDRTYLFRLQFATYPSREVTYSYAFGGQGENNLAFDEPGWSTQRRVSPGTKLRLHVSSDPAITTFTCAISMIEDGSAGKRVRLRAHHIQRGSTGCDLTYTVRQGEENIPSL